MEIIRIKQYQSLVGELIVGSFHGRLCMCDWVQSQRHSANLQRLSRNLNAIFEEDEDPIIENAIQQLEQYFHEGRMEFAISILFSGTEFQCRVWRELLRIPYGVTISYGELARRIGSQKGVRAVASAVGANPISIYVPCHRVIGSNKKLTGYAGGLKVKSQLLDIEKDNSI